MHAGTHGDQGSGWGGFGAILGGPRTSAPRNPLVVGTRHGDPRCARGRAARPLSELAVKTPRYDP